MKIFSYIFKKSLPDENWVENVYVHKVFDWRNMTAGGFCIFIPDQL
jgi:hypothetical protein